MDDTPPRTTQAIMRVLLADDHGRYRSRLRAALEEEDDITVVAEAADGRDAIRLAKELVPDVVVMDVAMPGIGGIEATRLIRQSCPLVRILALSMHRHPRFVQGMLGAGASGYALKENALYAVPRALRIVAGGGRYLCTALK